MPRYKMLHDGGTTGAKTKKEYKYASGQVISAPEGEFNHLGKGAYEVVVEPKPEDPKKPNTPNAGDPETRLADGSPATQDGVKTKDGK